MATKGKSLVLPGVEAAVITPVERHLALEMEKGSVSVSRPGLTFSVSGKRVKLQKQSPLNLSFESGEVEFDDGELQVKAEGDAITLQLD
jgi:hypothetical protein